MQKICRDVYMAWFQNSGRQGNTSGFYLIKNIKQRVDSYISIHLKIYANTRKYHCQIHRVIQFRTLFPKSIINHRRHCGKWESAREKPLKGGCGFRKSGTTITNLKGSHSLIVPSRALAKLLTHWSYCSLAPSHRYVCMDRVLVGLQLHGKLVVIFRLGVQLP